MLKKLCFIAVGFFCSGLFAAQAATTQQVLPTPQDAATQQVQPTLARTNEDSFNFVIANPNTIDPKRFIFELKPGGKTDDYVYVKNASDVPLKFNLYGSDGTQSNKGSFALKTKTEPKGNVGKWITFDEPELTLLPGETQKIKFTIAIPSDAKEGSYSGGISAEKSRPDAGNPNIIIAVRIALRVDVKVTSTPQPIEKKYADIGGNPFFQAYFWASLGLFVVSAGALGWSYYSNRKPVRTKRTIAKNKKKR